MKFITRFLVLSSLLSGIVFAQAGMQRREGYIPMIWDEEQGKLYFELAHLDQDILYFTEVAKGSGSGSVGLEWAGGGEGGVIQFQRVGPRVMVVQKNTRFRAGNGGAGVQKGLDASFPESIIASLPIIKSEGGKLTVDATPLVVRMRPGLLRLPVKGAAAVVRR